MWRSVKQLAAVAVTMLALPAAPVTALTLPLVGDTFVNSNQDTTNFGNLSFVEVGTFGPPKFAVERGLLQFDGSTVPPGTTFARATLRLFITDTTFDPLNLPITTASLATTFDEMTVDWLTQPAVVPGESTNAVMSALPGAFFDIDVTALVAHQLAAHPTFVALRIAATDEGSDIAQWFDFSSRQSEVGGAQLELIFNSPAPALSREATILLLAVLIAVGVLAMRRRPRRQPA